MNSESSTQATPTIERASTYIKADDISIWLKANPDRQIGPNTLGAFIDCCSYYKRPDILARVITRFRNQVIASVEESIRSMVQTVKAPGTFWEQLHSSVLDRAFVAILNEESVMTSLYFCCSDGHLEVIELLLKQFEKYACDRLLSVAAAANTIETVKLIMTNYKHLTDQSIIDDNLAMAYAKGNMEIVKLLTTDLSPEVLQKTCIRILNESCITGHTYMVQHILQNNKHKLKVSNLTVCEDLIDHKPKIADLLYGTFGEALLERYPSWTRVVKSRAAKA